MVKLRELADVVSSKNAGPFEVTLDILIRDAELFAKVRDSQVLSAELFASLYGVPVQDCSFLVYDGGYAFKCTIPRDIASGATGDTDGYGSQQYIPLLDVEIPIQVTPRVRQASSPHSSFVTH